MTICIQRIRNVEEKVMKVRRESDESKTLKVEFPLPRKFTRCKEHLLSPRDLFTYLKDMIRTGLLGFCIAVRLCSYFCLFVLRKL